MREVVFSYNGQEIFTVNEEEFNNTSIEKILVKYDFIPSYLINSFKIIQGKESKNAGNSILYKCIGKNVTLYLTSKIITKG